MTQPAVSNAVKRLRDALGDELWIRTAHGVKPTARAESLWPAVRRALAELEEAVAPRTFELAQAHATFRMAMADATAGLLLPPLVRLIENEAPGIDIRMVPLTTREPRPMLLRGDIDLAIGFFPGVVAQLQGSTETPVRHERLYAGEYVCVMRKEHPLADKELTLDLYCEANHLLVSFSGRARGLVDDALVNLNRERRILLTVNQFFTAGKVVAASNLLMVIPRHLIDATGMSSQLIQRALPLKLPEVHIDMLWHERDARSPGHRWLREQLRNSGVLARSDNKDTSS
jgi:DNA-binding transcriptional LysR family regulator